MFGDNDYEEWRDFLEEYHPPPYNLPNHQPALSFGVAGSGSGVPFHTHGYCVLCEDTNNFVLHSSSPGFAETIYGRKRWFLSAPDDKPDFHPNRTTLQWLQEDYQRVLGEASVVTGCYQIS